MTRNARRGALIAVACVLAGCSGSLFDSDAPVSRNYVIASLPPAANATSSLASQKDISIGRPDVGPGLDTQRIAVLKGRELDYFRGARWGDSTNQVVQSLLVNSLQDQKLFRSVTAEQARVAGDYVLDIDVRDFQAEYADENNPPNVRVTILGRLIRVADRELVGTVTASAQQLANDNRMTAVVTAFEQAAQRVALEIAQKTAELVGGDKEATSDERLGTERQKTSDER